MLSPLEKVQTEADFFTEGFPYLPTPTVTRTFSPVIASITDPAAPATAHQHIPQVTREARATTLRPQDQVECTPELRNYQLCEQEEKGFSLH